jgi:hypothetical protein
MAYVAQVGSANLDQATKVVAGSFSTVIYIYKAMDPINPSGRIKIAFSSAGDFGIPQFTKPTEDNFCSVHSTGNCNFMPTWRESGYEKPYGKELILQIIDGFLKEGDTITITFGNTDEGSRGWQVQTFAEPFFLFKTSVDPYATSEFKKLPDSPTMNVTPGPAFRAVCTTTSVITLDQKIDYFLRLEDRWGNQVGSVTTINDPGFPEAGNYAIEFEDEQTGLKAPSNPILVMEEKPEYNYYWADFSGQSTETCGTNGIEEYYDFGRNFSHLDILCHQACDYQITDAFWQTIKNTADAQSFKNARKIVVIPGYKWCASTPWGGVRNIFFTSNHCSITRSSRDLLPDKQSTYPDSQTQEQLLRNIQKQSVGAIAIANAGDRYATFDLHDANIDIGIEIHSSQGTFEWMLKEIFKQRYKVGFFANSAGHKGRPGASYPGATKNEYYGGLTCVLARTLSRRDIFYAIKERHTYATTGNRPIISTRLEVNNKPVAIMGDAVRVKAGDTPVYCVQVIGTAPIERIDLMNGTETISIQKSYGEEDLGRRIKIVWSGAEMRGSGRAVDWSGRLMVRDNKVLNITPINFWNPDLQPQQLDETTIAWKSYTSGGLAGVILELEDPHQGSIRVETEQGNIEFPLTRINYEPHDFVFDGIDKKISIYQLPDELTETDFEFGAELSDLQDGDNPIYIKMTQEDGHMAWSSPIYIDA